MTEEQQKEQFSIAYVRAVAAAARVNIYKQEIDMDSIDIGFSVKSVAGQPQSPKLDAQLKCVTKLAAKGSVFRYKLKVKNYNELTGDHYTPKILIVVLIPSKPADWLTQTADQIILRRCGYWASLEALAPSGNTGTVTVDIPSDQVFSSDALHRLLPIGGKR